MNGMGALPVTVTVKYNVSTVVWKLEYQRVVIATQTSPVIALLDKT